MGHNFLKIAMIFQFQIFVLFVTKYVLEVNSESRDVTTDDFQLDCLLTHNKYRDKHCATSLKFSPKLKLLANRRAVYLSTNEGQNHSRVQNVAFGENSYVMQYQNSTSVDCKAIVEKWFNERRLYNWRDDTKVGYHSRHFAQIVWNSTQRLGCASVVSKASHLYVVCNYYNLKPFPQNVSQNIISEEKCDQILSKRSFKYRELTNGLWSQQCLNEHNRIRQLHSVPPLTINDQMLELAQKRALEMARKGFRFFRHKNWRWGENIHWTKATNNSIKAINCKLSIGKWYQEINNYDWDFRETSNGTIRHFLQMVWRPTNIVGCAQIQNVEETKGGVYTVCLYDPKADLHYSDLHWVNVFPDISKITEQPTEIISIQQNSGDDYGHESDELDDETELEKEFKDVDDIIDTNAYLGLTPAVSLEDVFIKTTTPGLAFDRNEYVHKRKASDRRKT